MLTGFHHLTLRVSDLDRSREFYSRLPEFVLAQDFPDLGKLRYRIGDARAALVLVSAPRGTPSGDRFSEHRIGLDHVAVGVHGQDSLQTLETVLRDIGAETTGIHPDRAGDLAMITFRDPDDIQWEFFQQD